MNEEDRKMDKETKRREKADRKLREREEKERLKEERKQKKEAKNREKTKALEELQELPDVEEGDGEALYCGPEVEECIAKGEEASDNRGPIGEFTEEVGDDGLPGIEESLLSVEKVQVTGESEEDVVELLDEEELPEEEEKERWFSRLRSGLSKSRMNFVAPLSKAMSSRRFDESFWEEVEDILVSADVGMETTLILVDRVRERMARDKVKDPDEMLALFREVLADSLDVGERDLRYSSEGPSVFMVVGVNGTGKTTTIAKLAHLLRRDGKRVILAAGDTFRAAGIEQLETWGERVGVHTVKHKHGADAAAVIHDAVDSAIARNMDVVIADTAGRLHTKTNLMEELRKIKRVAERNAEVTETLLVIDATTGQNGLIQAREFGEAVEVTGVVLTKLDGTAKGGIVAAIVSDLGIPIKFIGVGEKLGDLHAFDPREFAAALFS
jgi:fused signal recognition particle receptor